MYQRHFHPREYLQFQMFIEMRVPEVQSNPIPKQPHFPLGHRIKGFGALQIAETNRRSFQIGTKAEAERTHREDGGLMIKMSDDYQE